MHKFYIRPLLIMALISISTYANITAIDLIDEQVILSLNLQTDEDYEMQTSTNLIDWLPIETLSTHTATGLWNALHVKKTPSFD